MHILRSGVGSDVSEEMRSRTDHVIGRAQRRIFNVGASARRASVTASAVGDSVKQSVPAIGALFSRRALMASSPSSAQSSATLTSTALSKSKNLTETTAVQVPVSRRSMEVPPSPRDPPPAAAAAPPAAAAAAPALEEEDGEDADFVRNDSVSIGVTHVSQQRSAPPPPDDDQEWGDEPSTSIASQSGTFVGVQSPR